VLIVSDVSVAPRIRTESVVLSAQVLHRSRHGKLTEMTNGVEHMRPPIVEENAAGSQSSAARPDNDPAQAAPDIFARIEKIRNVVSTLRERNVDAASCEGIETLASVILSTSSLRDPNDHRMSKLAEAIDLLERRVEALLEGGARIEQPHAGNQHPGPGDAAAATSPAVEPFVAHGPAVEQLGGETAEIPRKPPAEAISVPATATSLSPRRSPPAQRPVGRDPLAALATMTDEELIALFS
jgi:hypothetical protein